MLTNGCTEGLLLVAHGSSSPAGVDEALALGAAVASACPDVHVDPAFSSWPTRRPGPCSTGSWIVAANASPCSR